MTSKFGRPPGYYVDYEKIRNATSLSDPNLKKGLCYKARGDVTACLNCPDAVCIVGKKVRDLAEKETAPTQAVPPVQKQNADPVMEAAFVEALNSGEPVGKLIKIVISLPNKPARFSRKEALEFLYRHCEEHPDPQAKAFLDEAIDAECRKDYARMKKHVLAGRESGWSDDAGEKTAARIFASKYSLTGKGAMAYVYELKERYGDFNDAPAKKSSVITEDQINGIYEGLTDELERLQEEYDERVDEIEREREFIHQMIGTYQGMIHKIKEMENTLGLYPASDKTELNEALDLDAPLIDEEDLEDE